MAKKVNVSQLTQEVASLLIDQDEPVILERDGHAVAVVSPAAEARRPSAHTESYRWIQENRERLRKEFPGKTILVQGCEIVRVFEGPVDTHELNRVAKQTLGETGWAFAYLDRERTSLI